MDDHNLKLSSSSVRPAFPISRLILSAILLSFSISGWLRVWQAYVNWEWMEKLQINPGPIYFVLNGAVWGVLFLVSLVGLLYRNNWGGWFTISTAILYSVWRWVDRLVFVKSPLANTGWVFEVILNAALLLVLFFMIKGFTPSKTIE